MHSRRARHLRLVPPPTDDQHAVPDVPREDGSPAPHPSFPDFDPAPEPDVSGLPADQAEVLRYLAPGAWNVAGRSLGSAYAAEAFVDAERLVRDHQRVLREARLSTWPAAIAWRIAEAEQMLDRGGIDPQQLALELGSTVRTMRAKSLILRSVHF